MSLADLQSRRYEPLEDFNPEEDKSNDDMKFFPTLESVFDSVPSKVGFNIELKYPQMLANGEREFQHSQVSIDPLFGTFFVL